jgi:hypothetical protein
MKRIITMTLEGTDDDALDDAQAEAWKRIKAGNREGQDQNEAGGFSFTVDHPDEPDPDAARYRTYAQENLQRDGDLEFDDNAVVSMGSDPGAYVQAWKWVDQCDLPGEGDEGED